MKGSGNRDLAISSQEFVLSTTVPFHVFLKFISLVLKATSSKIHADISRYYSLSCSFGAGGCGCEKRQLDLEDGGSDSGFSMCWVTLSNDLCLPASVSLFSNFAF